MYHTDTTTTAVVPGGTGRTLLEGPLGAVLLAGADTTGGAASFVIHPLAPKALGALVHTHTHEDETVGRRGRTRERTVARGENVGHPSDGTRPPPHFDGATDQIADHVVQEPIGRDQHADERAAAEDVYGVHAADRRRIASRRRAERAEVVPAAHRRQRGAHRREIERARHMPGNATPQRVGDRAVVEQIEVPLAGGSVAIARPSLSKTVTSGCGRPRPYYDFGQPFHS